MKCSLTDNKTKFEWLYNPAVVTTTLENVTQQYSALDGSNTYVYMLGQTQSITVPLSFPGINLNLNTKLQVLRTWVKSRARLRLDYGIHQYQTVYIKGMSENIAQYRDGLPVTAEITLDIIIESNQEPKTKKDTSVLTPRQKKALADKAKAATKR